MSRQLREEAAQRLGHRIAGKYHLREVLGVGGMGVVYAAWHQFTERMVALKLLHASIASTPTHAQRFLQEATASAAIQHAGIAEVLDAGREADGSLYVAFELLEGEDLGVAILERRAPPMRILEVAVEVLAALGAAHTKGFVHRDIKPANIYLLRAPRAGLGVKLLDFGIARRVRAAGVSDGLTQAGAVVGTPYYMSPEQMCGEAVDGRADLWALAVVMYYGLTGDLPFKGRSYVALLTEMLRGGPPPLPGSVDLPLGIGPFLQQALAARIEDRFQSAGEMQVNLRDLLPGPSRADETERIAPEPTMALPRRPLESRAPGGTQSPTPHPSTTVDPPWQRALEDIEGEIVAIESRQPTGASPDRTTRENRRGGSAGLGATGASADPSPRDVGAGQPRSTGRNWFGLKR